MSIEFATIARDPLVPEIIHLLGKVCDLPDREEKYGLLKSLTDILILASYPPMFVGPENAQTDHH